MLSGLGLLPFKSLNGLNINNFTSENQGIYFGQMSLVSGTLPTTGYLADAQAFTILIHGYVGGLYCQAVLVNRIGRDEKYMGVRGKYQSGWNSWKQLI